MNLTKIAYNILQDMEDSAESVNDTYMYAWKSIPPHRPNVLSTYLAKITRRVSIDIFRKKHREKRIPSEMVSSMSELEECISDTDSTEHMLEAKTLAKAISMFSPEDIRRIMEAIATDAKCQQMQQEMDETLNSISGSTTIVSKNQAKSGDEVTAEQIAELFRDKE